MADQVTQTYATHRRYVPTYHFFLALILLLNLIWTVWQLARNPGGATVIGLLLAIGLIVLSLHARGFAKSVQDRVIRLEERLRMERLFPPDLKSRIGEFTVLQLVALRFASDGELVDLARTVLNQPTIGPEDIKKQIKNWRADFLRA